MKISHCYVSLPEDKIFLFLSVARVWSPSTLPMACMGSQAQEEAMRIKEKWWEVFIMMRSIEVIFRNGTGPLPKWCSSGEGWVNEKLQFD